MGWLVGWFGLVGGLEMSFLYFKTNEIKSDQMNNKRLIEVLFFFFSFLFFVLRNTK